MTIFRLILRGLAYHWRIHASVALGVAAATAVLTGALLVGDSVRGSLRALTLDRLGMIDEVLVTDRFFREQLVAELSGDGGFQAHYGAAVGVMLFPAATMERRWAESVWRSSNVLVVGTASDGVAAADFWELDDPQQRPQRLPDDGEIILNRTLADELQARVGDRVTLRLPRPEDIPADSPLGEKTDRIRSLPRLTVIDIIPSRGLGRFSLTASQTPPRNAYVSLRQLQELLEQPGRINSVLVGGGHRDRPPDPSASAALNRALRPTLTDLGLNLRRHRLTYADPATDSEQVVYDYFSITSDRMILPPEVEQAAERAFSGTGGGRVFTYLANLIETVDADGQVTGPRVPYSMVTAIDPTAEFSLLTLDGRSIGPLADDEMILTDWAATDLAVEPASRVRLRYFEPETTHGQSQETETLLTVKAITRLTPPDQPYLPDRQWRFSLPPTVANDADLTPEVRGVTDQRTIDSWEVPFTIDYSLIESEDDQYWETYATTPKAYVSLATGQRLWGSRFGQSTSYRIPAGTWTVEQVGRRLLDQLAADEVTLGFAFTPIKRRQLEASAGNTPFDLLFLSLSIFIIAAALLLVVLLFRLGFEQRASQAGLLLAVGWPARRLQWLLLGEGAGVAVAGSAVGIVLGLGYSMLMLAALRSPSWWLGAVTTPFLEFHYTPGSLLLGYVAGVMVSLASIAWSVFQTRRVSARSLLAGQVAGVGLPARRGLRRAGLLVLVLVGSAVGLAVGAVYLTGQSQAGAFVGAGALMLCALLIAIRQALQSGRAFFRSVTGRFAIAKLAARSAARHPGRSALTVGLIATASFLIISMSAFRLQPSETGTGGFTLVGESSQPVFADLATLDGREELLGGDARQLEGATILALRVRPGDDASCGNLYRASQPRILGVSRPFIEYFDDAAGGGFEFSASAATTPAEKRNPWRTLDPELSQPSDEAVPVIIDKETAMYSLQLLRGIGERFSFEYDGREIEFRVAGLLSLSVLHGNLLISESDFRRLFPEISGTRYTLIRTGPDQADEVARLLEDRLGDEGFDATRTDRIMASLMALQNTYLRTFQSLGALGLLLGTFGLAAVQARSVLERRGELALLRATGFRRTRLAQLILLENLLLLLCGLATGVAAALLAVLPHMFAGGATLPLQELSALLGAVVVAGLLAGWLTATAMLRVPLLAALREER